MFISFGDDPDNVIKDDISTVSIAGFTDSSNDTNVFISFSIITYEDRTTIARITKNAIVSVMLACDINAILLTPLY